MDNTITGILEERGHRYGPFNRQAQISQEIKLAIFKRERADCPLTFAQSEALEMIAHKIARIINGDSNYADSWDDIAGYATLISNDLKRPRDVQTPDEKTKRQSSDTFPIVP